MYPDADVFTLFAKDHGIPEKLRSRALNYSFLHRLPGIHRLYRPLLSLVPYAMESFDLRGYDLVITSDWACAKGVLTDSHTQHICYCHSPMRFIWDLYQTYLRDLPRWQRPFYAVTARQLRHYDFEASQRVDSFIANSNYIAQRIRHYYKRESTVIYPPVETSRGYISNDIGDYYLAVGRLNRTKRLDLLVLACNSLKRKLLISGWGPEEKCLKSIAGPTIEFLGRVPDGELDELYSHCRALLFAANEDFGIVPVEAQSFGRPVIAYGHGGLLETVRVDDPSGEPDTGMFFTEQTVESVIQGIQKFESREDSFMPQVIQDRSRMFDTSVFVEKMKVFVGRSVGQACREVRGEESELAQVIGDHA
jgi:glycosyltransferase involved in cell wall biosynthesis